MKPTRYRAPSAKRLIEALSITEEQANLARSLIQGTERTQNNPRFPKSNEHFNRCCHQPRRLDHILLCLNELLEMHGIECIRATGGQQADGSDIVAEYLNTGDTYAATILFNHRSKAFSLTSRGDFVGRYQVCYSIA